jgi:hypothetical protein
VSFSRSRPAKALDKRPQLAAALRKAKQIKAPTQGGLSHLLTPAIMRDAACSCFDTRGSQAPRIIIAQVEGAGTALTDAQLPPLEIQKLC